MGARALKTRPKGSRGSTRENRVLATICTAVALPSLLAYILVTMDIRTDLSEIRAGATTVYEDDAVLVGWGDLPTRRGESRVRMLGYMMDGDRSPRDGSSVTDFVLMPEAGELLHAAHRIPEQMVEVRTREGQPFRYRRLVWVVGRLGRTMGRDREHSAWAITDAMVEPATDREITRWFAP